MSPKREQKNCIISAVPKYLGRNANATIRQLHKPNAIALTIGEWFAKMTIFYSLESLPRYTKIMNDYISLKDIRRVYVFVFCVENEA